MQSTEQRSDRETHRKLGPGGIRCGCCRDYGTKTETKVALRRWQRRTHKNRYDREN
jgi:hypothetical protein